MKLFHFHDPMDPRFAEAGRRGTWSLPSAKLCPECGASRQRRVSPLVMEWLPGSDRVGDFLWPGFDDEVVVSQVVKEAYEACFRGFVFKTVEFWQDPQLTRSQKAARRTKPRIWLPYEGPCLWDMWVTAWCHLDINRSGIVFERNCPVCGRSIYQRGPFESRFLVLDKSTWRGEDIFRVFEYPQWIFCTENVKSLTESRGFSNVEFLKDGEIPE